MKVKAKVNVRHNGEDYEVGEEFEIKKDDFNEEIFEEVEEEKKNKK